jgi:hypothetical protein
VWQLRFQSTRSARRGGEDGEGGGGAPGEDGVPDAGGVGAARSVLDGVAGTRFLSIFFFAPCFNLLLPPCMSLLPIFVSVLDRSLF